MVAKETAAPDNEKGDNCECIVNENGTRPGFLNLNPRTSNRKAKSAPALNREKSKSMLMSEVSSRGKSSRSYLKKQNTIQEQSEMEEDAETLTPKTFTTNLTSRRKKLPDQIEYALVLRHPLWPTVASEWCERPRNVGWPGKRVEKRIVSLGCHVTPGAHPKSDDPDIEWTYTFYEAERIINKESISSVQRQCFIAFCLLCMDLLESRSLTLQQLKSIFYFSCETIDPQYWRKNLALCVNHLLDHLLECIRCANLPDYFVVKNNTLSHLSKTDLVKLEATVSEIRKNPAQYLISLTTTCAFVNIFPFYCSVIDLFNPFIEDGKVFAKKGETEKSIRSLLTVVDELSNSFYLDSGYQVFESAYEEVEYYVSSLIAHCVSGFEEAIEYFVKSIQGDKEAQKHLQFMPQLLSQKNITLSEKLPPTEIWRPIRMCRLLIQKYSSAKQGSDLYDHLGCMYHSASEVFKDQREEIRQKAETAFKEAIGKEDSGIGAFVDYGRFLCRTQKFEESISVLKKVVQKETKSPEMINFYGRMEAVVADDFIKKEIDANDGLEVLSVSYSLYLICDCYIGLKKKQDLFKTLKQFEDLTVKINDPQSFALLGYTYIKIRQFKKAISHFKTIAKLKPNSTLAHEYVAICSRHEGYDKSDDKVTLEGKMEKLDLWEQ